MTLEEQIDLATELWATAQCTTSNIGIEGVIELMLPAIAAYTAAVEAKERERCAAICDELRKQNQTMDLYWVADEIRNLK